MTHETALWHVDIDLRGYMNKQMPKKLAWRAIHLRHLPRIAAPPLGSFEAPPSPLEMPIIPIR